MTPRMLALHRWLGLVAGLMILVAATTAIGLNHQDLLRQQAAAAGPAGPYGKFVLSVAADPQNPRHLLMGTSDGLFRSDDGGQSWEDVVLPVPAEQVNTLLFDPSRPGVVYASFRSIGVYRSEDGGEIWEEVALPFNPVEGPAVSGISLAGDGTLVVATPVGLQRQTATGWQAVGGQRPLESGPKPLQIVYDLHDGRFWGTWGVPVTDAVSVALIGLVLTGYALFFGRAIKIRRARKRAQVLAAAPAKEPVAH